MNVPDALREAEREAKALIATAPLYCTLAEAVDAYRDAVAAEARAATGEVVGTGRVYRDLHSSMHVVPEQWHIPQDAVHPVHGIPVRVVRRDKEEG